MKAVVIYESMYGNTHAVADHIANGLRTQADVIVSTVAGATRELLADADLVVVGGPTHVHSMPSAASRHSAIEVADREHLPLDPAATNPGLRDWFEQSEHVHGRLAAAFDTRVDGWAIFSGRASHAIANHLERQGYQLLDEPESFLVDMHNHLEPTEPLRAAAWGSALADRMERIVDHHW